jgi:hypothetical protein
MAFSMSTPPPAPPLRMGGEEEIEGVKIFPQCSLPAWS